MAGVKCSETRTDGEPCNAWATSTGKCAGHSGLGIGADPAALGLRGHASRSRNAAKRRESLLERISRLTEEKASQITDAYLQAGAGGDWRALEALITRVHGKPVERVSVEAPTDPLGVQAMSSAERQALIAQVLEAHPHLAELTTRTARVQH